MGLHQFNRAFREFDHRVVVTADNGTYNEMVTWCENDLSGEFGCRINYPPSYDPDREIRLVFGFIDPQDAFVFKMRWA